MTTARDREALEQAIVRGSELLKQGKLDQALRAFHHALELDPENTKVLALLGLAHFRASQFAEARPIYEELVERASTDASHRLNLGLVYLKLGDGDRAIDALEASRALDPSQGRAVSYLGLAYARAGRYAEAYRSFLLAGQVELASEIEVNLTPAERDGINSQLGRTAAVPAPVAAAASERHAAPRPVTHPPSDRHTAVTGPIPTIGRASTQSLPLEAPPPTGPFARVPPTQTIQPAISRTASPRAVTQNIVSRAALEDAARGRPPSTPPGRSFDDVHTRPTPPPAPEITILHPAEPVPPTTDSTESPIISLGPAPRMTESQQFVLPNRDARAPESPYDGHSMVSVAVAAAVPAPPALSRTRTGGTPPRPLSELATADLVRPDDGDERLEIGANGNLIVRVTDRMMVRLDGVHVTGGDLTYEPATRRTRGHQTEERFDHGGTSLHVVTGRGYLIATPGAYTFEAVVLDDDILYLREDLVFAFESSLRWENGNVPGLRGKLPVVQFRGDGALALRYERPLVRVKLPPQGLLFVDADRIAGWIGRVIPRAVVPPQGGPMGAMCIECTGEGVVLVDPAPPRAPAAAASAGPPSPPPRRSGTHAIPPPPPPARATEERDVQPSIPPELAELAELGDDKI